MDAKTYAAALEVERLSLIQRGLATTDVDAELQRVGRLTVEAAAVVPAETAAMKRAQPRKPKG